MLKWHRSYWAFTSTIGIVAGYYQGAIIVVVGVGMLLAGIFISG
ncbi:MAG: hypothetical protein WA074_01220 [Lactobacillus amylovorus]|nr:MULTISPECIES: hypothetical protein [Lactobacillus]MDB6224642.1 hypothetical protein [Lactobacillus amylovorus]MDB6226722.1 hypothetical protein [Lactobacillus amylovorus]MDB6228825.1 hypothetical protein [Lactobacillus amylovorus]MDY4730066.1 hypothetical protein [Lactobacillus amylovorus]UXN12038.1 hypothetical protein N6G93_00875 [Lactobacillus amylovorus]